ncbi:MAG: type II toxin-antitoxin system VapC family toxin [Gammaproteobacteria bacterium]|nr:type II toxin-antitoxin system VapC family toxin [Gammaproteobacteria bacterium]
MVFIDASVPMYLIGAAHPNKVDAQRRLETLVTQRVRLLTDAEVLVEILHRYTAIERRGSIQPAIDALLGIVDEVLPIDRDCSERAKQLVLQYPTLSVRAALHVATMQREGIENVLSFDPAFDRIPGLTRLR